MAKAKKKAKKSLTLNFKGVEGKRTLLPEDDYRVEVEEVEMKEGDKAPYLAFTFKVTANADGTKTKHAGGLLWDNASTSEKSLWRLRSLLEALGVDVPDDEMDIETDDLVGREMVAVVGHEKDADYGTRAKLVDFYAIDEDGDSSDDEDGEEDEDDKKKSKKDKKKSKKSDDDDGDDESGDDEDEEDKKARRRKERRAERKKRQKGDDDDAGEDDEEEEKPSKKSSKKDKKKAKKFSADEVQDADEDELESIIEKSGIEVDLDDYKTLKKKQAAVIDALEDAELLESDDD